MLRLLLTGAALTVMVVLGFRHWSSGANPAGRDLSEASMGFSEESPDSSGRPANHSPIEIKILLSPSGDTASKRTIEVHGLAPSGLAKLRTRPLTPDEWSQLFLVLTKKAAHHPTQTLPSVSGEFRVDQNLIRFTPRFPFVDGMTYVARFNRTSFFSKYGGDSPRADSDDWLEVEVSLPKTAMTASTFVRHIYPSTEVVPVNLLKFYVQFSAPMSFGEAYQRIHLYEEPNREIEGAFLQVEQELWDPSQTRLTLLLDPGRIKRGLQPHQDLGLALRVGKTYRLAIDGTWPDAQGTRLIESYEKRFHVGDADRTAPDQTNWQWSLPTAGTRDPVKIAFSEPLDRALLLRMLEIRTIEESLLVGEIEIGEKETVWRFHPATAWSASSYTVRVNTALEDLAGNNLRAVFDVDLNKDRPAGQQDYLALPFTLKAHN